MTRRSRGTLERDIRRVLLDSEQPRTPAQVRAALPEALAYTTVMTVLARMHDKGEVTRHSAGRGYAYAAIRDNAEVTARRMQRLLGSEEADRAAVLRRFVGTLEPGDERLLRSLLDAPEESS
jgi:predicted transcriptional regulator